MDDALDYEADPEKLGKNVGDDLAEGKPTLPLIHALRHAEPAQAALIRQAIEQGGVDHLPVVLEAIAKAGSLAYTTRLAMNEAEQAIAALAILPPSPQREALEGIARFAAARDH